MISRNQLRQTVLQYLYAAAVSPEMTDEQERGLRNMLTETYQTTYYKLKAKALCGHLTRDYQDKLRLFVTRAKEVNIQLQENALTLPLRDEIHELLTKEAEFDTALLNLKKIRHADPLNEKGELAPACETVQNLSGALADMHKRFARSLSDYPAFKTMTASIISANNRLIDVHERLSALRHPEGHPGLSEVSNIIEAARNAELLQTQAGDLAKNVISHLPELDERINSVLENHSPERVTTMDRSILRLAAYELTYSKDLPTPIIVSEALRLASTYSSSESARFVNGILAGIAKNVRPNEQDTESR